MTPRLDFQDVEAVLNISVLKRNLYNILDNTTLS